MKNSRFGAKPPEPLSGLQRMDTSKGNSALVWFRNNLRLRDNPALAQAAGGSDFLLPVYTRPLTIPEEGMPGYHKAVFRAECLLDLDEKLRQMGSALLWFPGMDSAGLVELAVSAGAGKIFLEAEPGWYETREEAMLLTAASRAGIEVNPFPSGDLYPAQEIPFPLSAIPEIFTVFRKATETQASVRQPVPAPDALPPLPPGIPSGTTLPLLPAASPPAVGFNRVAGGETAAHARLAYYFGPARLPSAYKETRNGLMGMDYSSHFSPWLAAGCLSPAVVKQELESYESRYGSNESTYWLFFELLWREYFRWIARKHGPALYRAGGIRHKKNECRPDPRQLVRWKTGRTGQPFIDACMRELWHTGFMSNRGRQNAASYLVHDLKQDWREGARWFETQLVDYDCTSNWGNWNYVAGVGNDPREGRRFNPEKQAGQYDPAGRFQAFWGANPCPDWPGSEAGIVG